MGAKSLADVRYLRRQILEIANRYGVYNIRVFGSVARGTEADDSDVDLLVSVEEGRSLLDLGGFQMSVQELIGCKVDVVSEAGVRERIRERILNEAQPV